MTDREKAIVMAYTGAAMLVGDKFSIYHKYIEDICGRPIYTREIAFLAEEIKEKSRADFIELCRKETHETHECVCISRKEAVNALRKSLYDYEDNTEKQFLDSNDLDVSDWIVHRIFVENMNDADVKAINDLPSIQPEPKTGRWISHIEHCNQLGLLPSGLGSYYWCSECDCGVESKHFHLVNYNYCPNCGCRMESEVSE